MCSRAILVAVVVSSCAHLGASAPADPSLGRVYDGSEDQLKVAVARWFAKDGVTLEPWEHDPHVLVSRVKENTVGVVKGEHREEVNGPQAAPGGDPSAPGTIDAERERARTQNLSDTSRTGAREFTPALQDSYARVTGKKASGLQGGSGDPVNTDHWGTDRAAYVDRDWWEVRFHALSPRRTQVLILRNHASDWGGSADKSYSVGTSTYGEKEGNAGAVGLMSRDLPREKALAEHLDFSAAVELVGDEQLKEPERAVVPQAIATEVAAPSADGCGIELKAVELGAGQVMLLSDPEGTREATEALRQVICASLARGLPVTVALSISASEQPRLNAWMRSAGTPKDRKVLLDGTFWGRPWQDGRSSAALLELLEVLRAEAANGRQVVVLAADADLRGNPRTAFISSRLLQHLRENPERQVVGFFSNTLTSQRQGNGWDPEALPVGYRLASAGLKVQSYDVSYESGTQWTCRLFRAGSIRCGTWAIRPGPKQTLFNRTIGFSRFERPSPEGFDGLWFVGKVSASPPARGVKPFGDAGDLGASQLAPPPPQGAPLPSLF